MADSVSDFYSGLVAELYEPLAGDLADLKPLQKFLTKAGSPALELACGAGHPMLDLIEAGLEVHGIDSSADMLALCRQKAAERGLPVKVHCQLMQELDLPDRYRCCFIAGASFSLIDNLPDAQQAISRVYDHLLPGGRFLLSVFRQELTPQPSREKALNRDDGSRISVGSVSQHEDRDQQLVITRLCYKRSRGDEVEEQVERDWVTRWYRRDQLLDMLAMAGFETGTARGFDGSAADADCCDFSVVARKPV